MVKRNMDRKIQHFKKQGFTKAEIIRETGLNRRTVSRYYMISRRRVAFGM